MSLPLHSSNIQPYIVFFTFCIAHFENCKISCHAAFSLALLFLNKNYSVSLSFSNGGPFFRVWWDYTTHTPIFQPQWDQVYAKPNFYPIVVDLGQWKEGQIPHCFPVADCVFFVVSLAIIELTAVLVLLWMSARRRPRKTAKELTLSTC